MSLPPRFFDEIRSRLALSDVIGRRVKVTRAGREFKACCPFHHEKTPSFTINDDKQFYHCFGCGAHGDVIKFVMEHDNLAFMDAVEMLASEAGLSVPKPSPEAAAHAKKTNDLYDLLEEATIFFQDYLNTPKNQDVRDYIKERGISAEMLDMFRIGFSPDDGQELRRYLKDKGYSDKEMITAGLLRPSTKGGEPYAFFRDRVMFPVPDRRGRIVAFGGRILPQSIRPPQRRDFSPPKYINSSETPLFHKGRMLYGEPTARKASAEGLPIVLVEGYMDVIACVQAGIRGALAPMGTAVTEEQIAVMWSMIPDFTKVPILCFDGDNAGRKAAQRVCERVLPMLEPGRSVDFAFIPEGEDPDSLIKANGIHGVSKILDQAVPLFDFIWHSFVAGRVFKTPEKRAGVIKQLEAEVAKILNQDVQMHYRSLLRKKVSETFFARSGTDQRFGSERKGVFKNSSDIQGMKPTRPIRHDQNLFSKVLLASIINHPHIFDGVDEIVSRLAFTHPRLEAVRQSVIILLSENPDLSSNDLVVALKDKGFMQEIGDICNESVYVHASFSAPNATDNDVQSNWLSYWQDVHEAGLKRELRDGWRQALNEDDEEKLRALLFMKTST